MKLNLHELERIASLTLLHYEQYADEFWQGTRAHDVSQNIAAMLRYIEGPEPFDILDFGCGPGRDLKRLAEYGHRPVGLEGSARFAAMARAYSGCEVLEQDFLKLDLPANHFDAVFANASLFHIPSQELLRVLGELRTSLKPRGVLFSSNPIGQNEEGWSGERYGVYYDLPMWRQYLNDAGFTELLFYYRPTDVARHEQRWLASVWRRSDTVPLLPE